MITYSQTIPDTAETHFPTKSVSVYDASIAFQIKVHVPNGHSVTHAV